MTAAVVGLATSVALADRMDMHSFEAPYTHVDPSGSKSVSKDWKTGGVTAVNRNFVRLTPDRQVSRPPAPKETPGPASGWSGRDCRLACLTD